ncbi:MAG: hypothetical protein WED33_13415 [Bacteroidia bacterium]
MRLFLSIILFLITCVQSQAQSLYDEKSSGEFANYLYRSSQYDLAAIEFERLLFLNPNNDSLRVKLISCYSLNKEFTKAIERIKLFPIQTSELSNPLAELYSYNLISAGGMQPARAYLDIHYTLPAEWKTYYKAYSYLLENEFKQAAKIANDHPEHLTPKVLSLIEESQHLKHRSAGLATAMSAIVPGSGKFYTGDWKDAIIGLVSVGVTGYQAYRGFNRNGPTSTYGWIYASLSAGFYLGNIYGSYSSAKRFNKRQTDKIAKSIQQSFILNP